MNLEAIATYLERQRHGKRGETIFVTSMPTECKTGILLLGNYHGTPIDHNLRGWVRTEFRVAVRSPDYNKGHALAEAVSKTLTSYGEMAITGMLIKQCLPLNEPRPYRKTVGGYWEFEVDVDIAYAK